MPRNLLDIFKYYKQKIKPQDLIKLSKSEMVGENLINLYFKILEKINFVLLQVTNFLKTETPGGPEEDMIKADKVMYCSSNFIRKLRDCKIGSLDATLNETNMQGGEYNEMIKDIANHDTILIPFFPDQASDNPQPTMLVSLSPANWRTDLFEKDGRLSSHSEATVQTIAATISMEVVNIFKSIGALTNRKFNETMIDGGLNSVCVSSDEDYMIAMVYIADCLTFKRNVDLELFNVERERKKMCDTLLCILDFN